MFSARDRTCIPLFRRNPPFDLTIQFGHEERPSSASLFLFLRKTHFIIKIFSRKAMPSQFRHRVVSKSICKEFMDLLLIWNTYHFKRFYSAYSYLKKTNYCFLTLCVTPAGLCIKKIVNKAVYTRKVNNNN